MKKRTFRRIIRSMEKTFIIYATGLLGMGILMFILQVQIALMFQSLFDTLIDGTFSDVLDNIMLYLIFMVIIFMIAPFFIYLIQKSVVVTTGKIRRKTFSKLTRLPVNYFQENHSAEISSRLTNDITEVEKSYGTLLVNFGINLIIGIGTTVVMFTLEWRLALIGIFASILTLLVNTVFARRLRKISDKLQKNLATLNTKLSDIISGLQVVRIFNIQSIIMRRFNKSNEDVKDTAMDLVQNRALINTMNTLLGFMSFIGITIIGAYFVLIGEITVGTIIAVTQLQNGLRDLARTLGDFITNLQTSLSAGDRVFELLDEKEEPQTYPQVPVLDKDTAITLENLRFAYDDENVLDNFSLSLSKNQTAALVGPSGGGKSTVFKLLLQFYPPKEGGLAIDGQNAGDDTLRAIRDKIAYVPQDAHLFNATVRENIAYGNPGAEEDALIDAAKAANAHDFIMALPKGYDTMVGENGTTLSGGQRQRIAIARAVIKDAPILLLDEATSALDNESEKLVKDALETLMREKTSLIIAHRLSTIEHTDTIFVVDAGRIVEKGHHNDLLAKDGLYANLYHRQLRNGAPA